MPDGTSEAIAATVQQQLAARPEAAAFARILFAAASADALAALGPGRLAADAAAAVELIALKPPVGHRIRVCQRDPGTPAAATVLEIVNDDMPFLVDSVLGEVQARGLAIDLVLHPIFKARRDGSGRIVEIGANQDPRFAAEPSASFIAVHLARIPDAAAGELAASLGPILDQVARAVADWPAMLARIETAIAALDATSDGISPALKSESLAFLRWLAAGHFTFLGLRELRLDGPAETGDLVAVAGTGLGVLRDPSVQVLRRGSDLVAMTPEVRRFFFGPSPLIITKANAISVVHRRVHMDYIGIKIYGADTRPKGELRMVGLFTSRAYQQSPREIPFLRHKVETVRAALGYPPASHAGKALDNVLDTFPRDELFQIGNRQLEAWCTGILDLELRPRVRVFSRLDRFGRFASVLIYVPRERYSTRVREKIGAVLAEVYGGRISAYYPFFPDGPLARVQFIVARTDAAAAPVDAAELEARIAALTRTFEDDLAAGIRTSGADADARTAAFAQAFPAAYSDTFPAARALADIARLERLSPERPVAIDFHRAPGMAGNRIHAAVYRIGEPMRLSERVPLLENLGFSVIDERTFRLTPRIGAAAREVALHDMELETADGLPLDLDQRDAALEESFLAVLAARAENDNFNRLILASGLDWREAALLRGLAAYLRQIGSPFGPRYIADTLRAHAGLTRDLMELFHIRFNPDRAAAVSRDAAESAVRARIDGALAKVPSLDEDRILRLVLNLIDAIRRTNFFRPGPDGQPAETIAFKLASREVDGLPEPHPLCEIFVSCPRVDGVHLRFAPIARGGIRWSDRAQDYRTEVLGLVKAQLVKNAVIVPSGAKGGFLPKQMPRAASRDETMKEGIAAYRIFISAMLDLTDNLVDGKIVPPPRVVRRDGDDPYFVVAADKGTATFSDIANEISAAHGFWLGDAFASGGSAGYDHKKMAITARGAWECVKRHFREMDWDIQTKPFRVTGVGDMSGDVFGNGMLLSPAIRLVAAFDHRDIFLDPDPDPAAGLAERQRLFDLPRSSWQDYDKTKLSKGGGIFPRSVKSIPLAPEVRALLGVTAAAMAPADLMRTILKCETDLLWFGGIGTYVRASAETDEQAGDRANDAIRIAGAELRAKVIGEGANLGMTQRGRVEFAQRGGRLNTDFIDNSAGVNSSDQEVNIKIAVGAAVQSGRLTIPARNALLASMTSDVAAAVLVNNYQQGQALSLAEATSARDSGFLIRLMHVLEDRKLLARALEALPSDAQLAERVRAGRPLTRPELAVLLSFSKIALTEDLLASRVPDQPFVRGLLAGYFPQALRAGYADDLARHRLAREIVATAITNKLVNRGGPALATRLADETGRSAADVATAFLAADRVLGVSEIWSQIDALDGAIGRTITGRTQLDLYLRLQEFLQTQTLWFLRDGAALADFDATVGAHAAGLAALNRALGDGREASAPPQSAAGIPPALANAMARLDMAARAPEITRIADETRAGVPEVARAFLAIGEHFQLAELAAKARAIPAADYYDRLAVAQAGATLAAAQAAMTRAALRAAPSGDPGPWLAAGEVRFGRARETLVSIARGDALTVSRLTVAAAQLRDLAGA